MLQARSTEAHRLAAATVTCLLLGIGIIGSGKAFAQSTTGPMPCDNLTAPKSLDDLKVVGKCTVITKESSGQYVTTTYETTPVAQLGDRVLVLVSGLARFRSESKLPIDWSHLVLFLDGQALPGVTPRSLPDASHSHLEFTLKQDSNNRETWNTLLSGAIRSRAVPLSVGFDGQAPLRTDIDDFKLVAIPLPWLMTWVGLCLFTATVLFWAARDTNLLRDVGPEPPAGGAATPSKTFSLARTQMAVWFFVVLASYVFIWLVTGTLDVLTSSVLGLVGISAATAVAGGVIDTGRQAAANPPPAAASDGFFIDILSDEHGVSLARVQIAIWTMVLVIIFARSVWRDLAMPQFDATLLGLSKRSTKTVPRDESDGDGFDRRFLGRRITYRPPRTQWRYASIHSQPTGGGEGSGRLRMGIS
jgi:hypothetical protein